MTAVDIDHFCTLNRLTPKRMSLQKDFLYHRSLGNMREPTLKWTKEVFCPNDTQPERSGRYNVFYPHLLYKTCIVCRCINALWTEAWVMPSCATLVLLYCSLICHFNTLITCFTYMSGTFNTEYLFSMFALTLISNRFTACGTVWFSD
jgi:hypothetical protein